MNISAEFEDKKTQLEELSQTIKNGAKTFLYQEYIYLTVFILLFGAVIFFFAEHKKGTFYTTGAFIIGAYTSIICGYIGMMIATSANSKTAYFAQ
jgi:Na+/H+-translocating membrane pyrophosphatase